MGARVLQAWYQDEVGKMGAEESTEGLAHL